MGTQLAVGVEIFLPTVHNTGTEVQRIDRLSLPNAFYFYRSNGIKYAVKTEIKYGSNMQLVLD